MKISILIPSLASNGIARAWILAKLLERHYEVETLGLLRPGEEVFPWFSDYPWGVVRASTMREGMRKMEAAITGDVTLAYCVSMTSFGVGLQAKRKRGIPLVLDMPEWEVHDHWKRDGKLARAAMITRELAGPGWDNGHSFKYRWILDHLTGFADERLVCCRFLEDRYGGVLLPQGPDTSVFDPAAFDKMAVRRKWGVPEDATILLFGGNPQPNKGVDETIGALNALEGKVNARLVIVGRDASHAYTKQMIDMSHGKVIALGPQPFPLMPELLSMADIVALPQTREPKSLGYIPCKMYEAMAMGIPVISSDLCDIPEILDGCGYIVPTEDNVALQAKIEHVLLHPEEARATGVRARQRIIERYSWGVMEATLKRTFDELAQRTGKGAQSRRAARRLTDTQSPQAIAAPTEEAHPVGWWQDTNPESAHSKYLAMHASETNRAKNGVVEQMLSRLDWKGKSVLEFGCGGGHFTIWMARQGAMVHAVEHNPNAIAIVELAARKAGVSDRVKVIRGDANNETVAGHYDFIFAKDLIEHLEDDGSFLKGLADQLRPGGRVFIGTQNDHCLNYLLEGSFERFVRGNRDWRGWDSTHYRFYNAATLKQKLRAVGIKTERYGSSYLLPWRFLTRRLTGRVRPWSGYTRLDLILGTLPPFSRLGWSIMVLGRKPA